MLHRCYLNLMKSDIVTVETEELKSLTMQCSDRAFLIPVNSTLIVFKDIAIDLY